MVYYWQRYLSPNLGRAMFSKGRNFCLLFTVLGVTASCSGAPTITTSSPTTTTPATTTTLATTTAPPTTASPAATTGCKSLKAGEVAETSILIPGPNNGLDPSPNGGDPLIILGVVADQKCQPVAGASVNMWHTDGAGYYGPGDDCCYYMGVVQTDANGAFRLETVRPAGYRSGGPAHVHVDVTGGGSTLRTELLFSGDPQLPAAAGTDGTIVLDLTNEGDESKPNWFGEVVFVLP